MTAQQKLVWLRYAVAKAAAATQTLSVWLTAQIVATGDKLVAGRHVASVSAGGSSTGFQLSGQAGRTPDDQLAFWEELLALYDNARLALIAAGDASPSEAEIVVEMRARLQPIESAVAGFDDEWVGRETVSATSA